MKFTVRILLVLLALMLASPTFAQQLPNTSYSAFSSAFAAPALTGVGSTTLTYTAGTIYKGGTSVSISASTMGSFAATKNNCDGPLYTSCEFIYWTSGTGLTHTTTLATAFASTNVVVAFVTTDGSSQVAAIVPATLQMPVTPVELQDCGNSTSCTSSVTINGAATTVAEGSAALTLGTVTITGLVGFTQNATTLAYNFGCTASFNSTTTGAGSNITCVPQSATSIKITVGNTGSATDIMRWQVVGYFLDQVYDGLHAITPRRYWAEAFEKILQ